MRLTLPTRADLTDCHAMWQDPDVVRHIGPPVTWRDESWRKLLSLRGLWDMAGYGYWIAREHNGAFVGALGFADFARDMAGVNGSWPEAGWVLARHAQGKGFAREALLAAHAWCEASLKPEATWCIIDPANLRSQALAAWLGYARHGDATFHNAAVTVYVRTAPRREG